MLSLPIAGKEKDDICIQDDDELLDKTSISLLSNELTKISIDHDNFFEVINIDQLNLEGNCPFLDIR